MEEGDECETAFKTPLGHFEYLIMAIGLTNAPVYFQSLINDILRDFLNVFPFVYLDNILIYSKKKDQHSYHSCAVFQKLYENQLCHGFG